MCGDGLEHTQERKEKVGGELSKPRKVGSIFISEGNSFTSLLGSG